jgi:carbonic anhydrase
VTQRPHYREALTETAIAMNAVLTAYTVQQELHGVDPQELRAVFGVYLLQSHEVWSPGAGLVAPPADLAAFAQLNEAIVRSERIASLLDAT